MQYHYRCTDTTCKVFGEVFEVTQKLSEDRLTKCVCCEEESLQKVLVKGPGIRLQGQDWGGRRNTI